MPAYAIGLLTVSSTDWVKSYVKPTAETIAKFGGRYLARNAGELVEGSMRLPDTVVVLEFPSLEQAKAWYGSADYAPLKSLRQAGSKTDFILVDGMKPKT